MKRRKISLIFSIVCVIVFCFSIVSFANYESYPEKPIKLLIPYSAGGGTDSTARIIASIIYPEFLSQPVTIINRPGANGAVALTELANAEPDGYTLVATTSSSINLSPLTGDLSFSLDSFTPISRMMDYTGALCVKPDAPWKNINELLEYSKKNPGKVRYSTSGVWSMEDLAVRQLNLLTGTKWTLVPFPGVESVLAVMSGAVEVYAGYGAGNPQIKAGLIRPLVAFGDSRINWLPDLPTLLELGYDVSSSSSFGLLGPKGLPQPIVDKLEKAFYDVYNSKAYQKIVQEKLGLGITWMGAVEFEKFNKDMENKLKGALIELGEYKEK